MLKRLKYAKFFVIEATLNLVISLKLKVQRSMGVKGKNKMANKAKDRIINNKIKKGLILSLNFQINTIIC